MFAARSEGGYGMAKTRNAAKPLSSICLIPLCLSQVNRPGSLRTRENEKDESDPPQTLRRASTRSHGGGVALVLIYPCGKAQNSPPAAALKARRRTYDMA